MKNGTGLEGTASLLLFLKEKEQKNVMFVEKRGWTERERPRSPFLKKKEQKNFRFVEKRSWSDKTGFIFL